jgi:biotin operon repressor
MDRELRDIDNGDFLWMRRNLLREHGDELGVYGIAVYAALASYAGGKGEEYAFPSISTLADLLECSENKVRETIHDLRRLGWIAVEKQETDDGRRMKNRYYFLADPTDPAQHEGAPSRDEGTGVHDMKGEGSRDEGEVKRKEEKPIAGKGSSGGAPARADAKGDSVPASSVEVEISEPDALALLPPEYSVYEPEVRACMKRYDASEADQLVRNQFGPGHTFSTSSVADLVESHEWPLFVIAVVLTANEAKRPNLRYVRTICQRGVTPSSSTNSNNQPQSNGRDAKQEPARNHERIGAAIDAAFDD